MSLSLSPPEPLSVGSYQALSRSPEHSISILEKTEPTGFRSPCSDYVKPSLDLNEYLVRHPAASYYFTIDSQDCEIATIFQGDKLLVDRSIYAGHGNIVVAVVDGEYVLKHLRFNHGCYELHSDLDYIAPLIYNNAAEQQLQTWGVVTAVVRKLKV